MKNNGLVSDEALRVFLGNSDTPFLRQWVLAVLSAIRQRFPRCDFYVLNRVNPKPGESRIYIGIGARRPGTASGKNALILIATKKNAFLAFQHNGQFSEKYSKRLGSSRVHANHAGDLTEINRWLEKFDLALEAEDRRALEGEARTLDDYLGTDLLVADEPAAAATGPRMTQPSLNQILYGPPGTGKTYATIDHALAILAPEFLAQNSGNDPETRKHLKAEFDRFVAEERVRFVTFHQSFSYEDFVEGLRATTNEANGQLRYEVVDGVFKQMCSLAPPCTDEQSHIEITKEQRLINFRLGGKNKHEEQIKSIINKKEVSLEEIEAKPGDILLLTDGITFLRAAGVIKEVSNNKVATKFKGSLAKIDWLKTFNPPIDLGGIIKAPSAVHQEYLLKPERVDFDALQRLVFIDFEQQPYKKPSPKVLIIDEINRGNVSRIFGELITLIEPSKRAGAEEALEVLLPYSKKPFSVPDNVYLIGTMNSTDRSLAGLDIALRRRFTFREMPPRPELLDEVEVAGLNIGQLLRVMNQRIEVLLDRDHCLGHAYFMPLKDDRSLVRLELIFRNQILPLLQEYFFEDWERIQWVFNDHRKPAIDRFVEQDKQDFAALFGNISVPAQGAAWRINDAAFQRISAYAGVIAVKSKIDEPAPELAEENA